MIAALRVKGLFIRYVLIPVTPKRAIVSRQDCDLRVRGLILHYVLIPVTQRVIAIVPLSRLPRSQGQGLIYSLLLHSSRDTWLKQRTLAKRFSCLDHRGGAAKAAG